MSPNSGQLPCVLTSLGEREKTHPNIPMPLEVKHGKTTNITQSIDMHRKLSEEVDDGEGGGRERVDEDEGCEEDGGELLEEEDEFHGEEEGEGGVHLCVCVCVVRLGSEQGQRGRTVEAEARGGEAEEPTTHLSAM